MGTPLLSVTEPEIRTCDKILLGIRRRKRTITEIFILVDFDFQLKD